MKLKNRGIAVITACLMLLLSSSFCFASQSIDTKGGTDESFSVENIVGGAEFINGVKKEMSKEEAQASYLEDIHSGEDRVKEVINDMGDERYDGIMPRAIVKTEITSHSVTSGKNVRISPISYNKTSSPVKKTITGSHTWTASLTSGIDADSVVKTANAKLSVTVAYSKTKSDTTEVTIKPGEKFYITFTPKYVKVSGRQLVYLTHGQSMWKNFSGTFPKIIGGEYDGKIYYITKKF